MYCYRWLGGGTNSFSMHMMKDVDNIKKYQLKYLEHYQGDYKEHIENVLFSEVAAWTFLYIQRALEYLNEAELIMLINEILSQPRFVLAREYYVKRSEEKWDAVDLLRKADAHEYIIKAKENCGKQKVKDIVRDVLKQIYTSI